MTKGKNAQYVILNEKQIETLIYSSMMNVQHVDIEAGQKVHNNFQISLIADIVDTEIFPNYDEDDLVAEDYDIDDLLLSHCVEYLAEFVVDAFRLNNEKTNEKIWGFNIVVNQKNIADFISALAALRDFWDVVEEEESHQNAPSKDSFTVDGNGTVN